MSYNAPTVEYLTLTIKIKGAYYSAYLIDL